MARQPRRDRVGFGILDGYASDAAFLSALGQSAKRGDQYFNTTSSRYRYYDGTNWHDSATVVAPQVDLIDHSFSSVPSGPQTVDGVSATVGMTVILANFNNGAYTVAAGVWTANPIWDGSNLPTESKLAYVKSGSIYGKSYLWYDGTSWRILNLIREATQVGAVPVWDGQKWVADNGVILSSSSLSAIPNAAADGTQAPDLSITGGNKTAGTGDGGDVNITGGSSTGGQQGRTIVDALATQFKTKAVLPATPLDGDWIYYNGQFRYWNSVASAWQLIYPLPTGTVDKSILSWDMSTSSWKEDAYITASGNTIAGAPDNANDAFAAGATYVYGATKTAGTGNGGLLGILGGNSFGGIGGAVQILGGTGPTTRGTVYVNKIELHTDSLTSNNSLIYPTDDTVVDAAAAANLTVRASNKTAGTGNGGDLFLASGTSFGGLQGSAAITARKIRLNAPASSDPSGGLTGDVYYNTTETRFKYYDGSTWRALGGGTGVAQAQYSDVSSTSLPASAPFAPDGTNVVTGDVVLFTNLSVNNNRFYKATVSGPSITWQLQILGQDPSGAPTDGDGAYIQKGTARGDQLWFYNGSVWYNYGTSLGGFYANVTLSNLTSPTAINQDLTFAPAARAISITQPAGPTAGGFALTVRGGNAIGSQQTGGDLVLKAGAGTQGNSGGLASNSGRIRLQAHTTGFFESAGAVVQTPVDILLIEPQVNNTSQWTLGFGAGNYLRMQIADNNTGHHQIYPNNGATLDIHGSQPSYGGQQPAALRLSSGVNGSVILQGGDGSGTDSGGGSAYVQAGRSTGNSSGADIFFQRSRGTVSGSSYNSYYNAAQFSDTNFYFNSGQGGSQGLQFFIANGELRFRNQASNDSFQLAQGKLLIENVPIIFAGGNYGNASGPAVRNQNGGGTGLFFPDDNTVALATSGTERFRLLSTGEMRLGDTTNYAEFVPLQNFAVAASQTNQVVFSVVAATYKLIIVEFQTVRNGHTSGGTLRIVNNGTTADIIEQSNETGDTGVTYSADISGANVRLLYSSDASGAGTFKYHVRRW